MGVDWGKARIGVAASNAGTSLAYPVETVAAGAQELQRLAALAAEYEPGAIYVGLPLTLSGERQQAAQFVTARAEALATISRKAARALRWSRPMERLRSLGTKDIPDNFDGGSRWIFAAQK